MKVSILFTLSLFLTACGSDTEKIKMKLDLAKDRLQVLTDSSSMLEDRLVKKRLSLLLDGHSAEESSTMTEKQMYEYFAVDRRKDAAQEQVDSLTGVLVKLLK